MEFLSRTYAPRYRGCNAAQPNGGGILAGLCNLFGGAMPAYRGADGCAVNAAPARCWWQLVPAPAYKAAPAAEPSPADPVPAGDADECECPVEEIHIWPDCPIG